jgi:hypothetical protein
LLTLENSDLAAAKAARRNGVNRYNGHNGLNVGPVKLSFGKASTTSHTRRELAPQQPPTNVEDTTDEETPKEIEPVQPKEPIIVAYFGSTPKPPTEFPTIDYAIPNLKSLSELVGWTDVFVHRIGEMVLVEQRVG